MNYKNEPAFPCGGENMGFQPYSGMTLRDYFAAKAMQSFIIASAEFSAIRTDEGLAKRAYQAADAMLDARGDNQND